MEDIHVVERERAVVVNRLDLVRLESNKFLIRVVDTVITFGGQIFSRLYPCIVLSLVTIQSFIASPLICRILDIEEERPDISSVALRILLPRGKEHPLNVHSAAPFGLSKTSNFALLP